MAYIGSSPTKVVSRQSANIFTYTVSVANTTVFSGADDNGNTLACSPSDIMVHINGLRMEKSDFSATSTSVTLVSGGAVGDEVTITAFLTFESADHYTKSAADARYEPIDSAYTKTEADARYQNISTNVVASGGFGYVNHNSHNTFVNLGGLTLPSSGIWVVSYQSRFGFKSHSAYHKVALSTSTTSGGVFSTYRMVAERIGNHDTNNANIAGNHMWYIDVANGNSSKSVYVISYQNGSSTTAFYQDDGNGETGLIAWKLRESTTSGTGVSNVGL